MSVADKATSAFALRPALLGTKSSASLNRIQDRLPKIIFKISLYPIALIILNVVITVSDLVISKSGGVYSRAVYALYTVHYLLYGGRGIIFALVSSSSTAAFGKS
jgi:hypothetical protein